MEHPRADATPTPAQLRAKEQGQTQKGVGAGGPLGRGMEKIKLEGGEPKWRPVLKKSHPKGIAIILVSFLGGNFIAFSQCSREIFSKPNCAKHFTSQKSVSG